MSIFTIPQTTLPLKIPLPQFFMIVAGTWYQVLYTIGHHSFLEISFYDFLFNVNFNHVSRIVCFLFYRFKRFLLSFLDWVRGTVHYCLKEVFKRCQSAPIHMKNVSSYWLYYNSFYLSVYFYLFFVYLMSKIRCILNSHNFNCLKCDTVFEGLFSSYVCVYVYVCICVYVYVCICVCVGGKA